MMKKYLLTLFGVALIAGGTWWFFRQFPIIRYTQTTMGVRCE